MLQKGVFSRLFTIAGALWIFVSGDAMAQLVPKPTITWNSVSEYIVSYQSCAECLGDGIEAYQEQSQSWEYIGSGPQLVTGQLPGTYRYRAVYAVETMPGQYQLMYSEAVSAVVADDQQPVVSETPSLSVQLDADFEVLAGDIDGDGRRDLMVNRIRPLANWSRGPIDNVLLRQVSEGSFTASIPDAAELASAAGWLPAQVELRKRDVNVDGYADLVLRGLSRSAGFSGVANQILFAPGNATSGQPAVRAATADLSRFSQDMNRHLIDPEFYPNNVPISYAVYVYYTIDCGWNSYYGGLDGYFPSFCLYEPHYLIVAYQDFSGFDQDAMAIASKDYGMIHGYESPEVGMPAIASTIERVLGLDVGDGETDSLLGSADADAPEATRRGIALFSALAGISEAVAQESEGGQESSITERVQIKGRRVLGQGPFHSVLEFRYTTISAYDSDPRPLFDGRLVSEVDWPRDHPSLTLRLGYVDGPGQPSAYWSSLLAADARYDDELRYDLFPSLGEGGYNSNSYVSGLIQATAGLPTVQMASFVGGEQPVPVSAFN